MGTGSYSLANVPANANELPLIASAIAALVHSSALCGLAITLGICSDISQKKNMNPNSVVARYVFFLMTILIVVAKKATPTKYAQNNLAGIQEGIRVAI